MCPAKVSLYEQSRVARRGHPALFYLWAQVKQHAPSLKVAVYAGMDALRGYDEDTEDGDKKRRKLSPKKMSREQKFKAAQVLRSSSCTCSGACRLELSFGTIAQLI